MVRMIFLEQPGIFPKSPAIRFGFRENALCTIRVLLAGTSRIRKVRVSVGDRFLMREWGICSSRGFFD